jgi:tetratricopeptide (TPR) repeat protein
LLAQRLAMDKAVDDIQTILNDGKPEEAAKLINEALAAYGGSQDADKLLKLKRQADALLSTSIADPTARRTRFAEEAEAALRDNNLRAAAASYDQALAAGEEPTLKQKADELRGRLAKYDECVAKAGELRRDPLQWEEALTQYETAAKSWETPQLRQDIADMQLSLQKRRPRLGVADFEMRGDVGVPLFGKTVSEELLGGFKIRYDLVERSQLDQVVNELKLQSSELIANQDGRREVGRLAKLQYMVVGSVSPISGVTVNARLVDVRTGLIVQTGKISAPTAEEAVKLLPQLAQILMMSDEEKTAYEKQSAEQAAAAPPPAPIQENIPPPPSQETQPPPPVITTTHRPPDMGNLQATDFDRIPQMPMQGQPVQEVIIVQEQPVRRRMLAIQLELGDNLYRRGRYREAHFHFMMARDIAPTETAVMVRIDNCQPYIPPPVTVIVIQPPPPPRDRIAVMNFLYSGDPTVVPPYLSTWTPDHLAPYFCPPFDVVDRTELYWYMARMGLTVSDVMNNPSARRWLARALRVRYFVFGSIQQTNSFLVTTHMVDAETGCLVGRGCVHARYPHELKCQLDDLARDTLSPPRQTVVVVQQAEQRSRVTVDIHLALGKGDFELALTLTKRARSDHHSHAELVILEQRAEEGRRAYMLRQERERQWAKIQHERDKIAREQEKFQTEAARQAAMLQEERVRQGAKFAHEQAKRQEQVDAAVVDLVNRSRVARNLQNYPLAIQFMESAVSLKPMPESRRELAELRTLADQNARRQHTAAVAARERNLREKHESELVQARGTLEREQTQRLVQEKERLSHREKLDVAEYNRLMDQAKRLHAQDMLNEALAAAQSAKHLRKTDEVEGLINSYSVELARKQATAKGDKERKELEERLAQEKTRREAAERLAKENQRKYEAALKLAQEAMTAKNYKVAVSRYQDAAKVFRTDEALSGQKAAELALAENDKAAVAQNRKAEEERQKGQRLVALKAKGKDARDKKQYAAALQAYQDALKLAPDDVELRTEIEEIRSEQREAALAARTPRPQQTAPIRPTEPSPAVAEQQQKKREYDAAMAQGKATLNANRYDEAITHFQKAKELMPKESDPGIYLATAERKRDAARPKPVDTVAQKQKQEAEARRQQIAQLLTKARQALQAKRFDEAEQGFNEVLKLEPNNQSAMQGRQSVVTEREAMAKTNEAAKEQQLFQKHIQEGRAALQAKNFDAAIKAFEQASQLRPNNPEAKTQLAQARQMQQQARAAAEKNENEKRMAEQRRQQVADLIAKGQAAMQAKDFAKAENFFNEALKVEPNNQAAQQGKRDAFTSARAKAQAEADAQKAAQMKGRVQQHLDAGKAALQAKKYDEAIQSFEQALKLDDDNREAVALLNQAKQEKQRAANPPSRPDPNAQRRQQVAQHLAQAKAHFQNKKYGMAIQEYQQALRLDPDNQEAKAGLAQAQKAQGAGQPGQLGGNQPGKPGPGDDYAKHMQQARGLEQQQRWKAAADAYKQALQAKPGDAQATSALKNTEFQMYMNQGKSLLQSGKKKEAADAFAAALQRFPNHPEATKLYNQAKSGK